MRQRPDVPNDGFIRIARERRRASSVTLVFGVAPADVDATGKELRGLCGTGGTTKTGIIELQGDHRDRVAAYFEAKGRRVKRMGG